ncbi:hypothetical protein PO883_31300 [Massilia sp. DJPM01]|nr:hypothetical protein [Massilia sp. DJPM01]MDM5181668.1 hypothetical protein [Massilia sp. DJPM01]
MMMIMQAKSHKVTAPSHFAFCFATLKQFSSIADEFVRQFF